MNLNPNSTGLDQYRIARDLAAEIMLAAGKRRCCTCKTVKPLEDFYRHRGNPAGRAYRCASCSYAAAHPGRAAA